MVEKDMHQEMLLHLFVILEKEFLGRRDMFEFKIRHYKFLLVFSRRDQGNMHPGFIIPFGSRASLTRCITVSAAGSL